MREIDHTRRRSLETITTPGSPGVSSLPDHTLVLASGEQRTDDLTDANSLLEDNNIIIVLHDDDENQIDTHDNENDEDGIAIHTEQRVNSMQSKLSITHKYRH